VIYAKGTAAGSDVVLQRLEAGDTVRLGWRTNWLFPGALSGRTLLLTEAPPTDDYFLSQLTLDHPGVPSKLEVSGHRPSMPSLSPDGRLVSTFLDYDVAPDGRSGAVTDGRCSIEPVRDDRGRPAGTGAAALQRRAELGLGAARVPVRR
jgi:hypothetical protein